MKYEYLKGSEKDFEGAPDWATHVVNEGNYDAFSEGFDYMSRATWTTSKGNEFNIGNPTLFSVIAERRPITEPVWSGEGLPPVGVECEYELYSGEWIKCRIEFVGRELMIVSAVGGEFSCGFHAKFRPIRSPEDVARDEAIEAMRDVGYTLPAAIRFTKEEMGALYDAGYRKAPDASVDDMWRAFEKSSDMEDVHKLIYGDKGK